ncbi:MAG: histidine kinase [Ornithinibacter sp.]
MARLVSPRALGRLPVTDVVLAAALGVLAVGGLVTGQVREVPLAITIPVAAASTLAMAVRTRFPLSVAGLVSALAVTQTLLTDGASTTLWSLVVFLVSAYTVAAERDEGGALVGLALVLGGQFLCEFLVDGSGYPFDTFVFGGVWLFGRGTRSWRNQAKHAEQHREDLARIAVAEERTRIARELHDVVAHSLSVIAVQADAAEAALATEPSRAGPPMRAIRASARDALADMRQLLHLPRNEEDVEDLAPARGLKDLPQLVAGMRASGLAVHVDIRATGALSSGMELAAYRIAQEGLTNVRKHAGDAVTHLVVARDEDELRIEVHNGPPAAPAHGATSREPTGHGLVGVRERVDAAGGTVDASPTPSGGFDLVARLPLGPVDGTSP